MNKQETFKLGASQIDAEASSLIKIKQQIEADPKGKPPAVLAVIHSRNHERSREGLILSGNITVV